jgi:hypothetical protein
MTSHQRCINCDQRKNGKEYTVNCPARQSYGHDWKIYAGNGVGWSESLLGKLVNWLWATKIGKVIVIIGVVFLLKILLK